MESTQKIQLKTKTAKEKGYLAVLMLITTLISLGSGFLIFVNLILTFGIKAKPAPTLVQLESGEAIAVKAKNRLHREPKVIQQFLQKNLTIGFTWDGYLTAETPEQVKNPVKDPGIEIRLKNGNKKKISTGLYESTMAYDPDFAKEFLPSIANIFPSSNLTTGKQTHIFIKDILEPEPIPGKQGYWKVPVIASLITFSAGNNITDGIPFKREIYVRAVDPPRYEPEILDSNYYARKIHQYRQAGLEIIDMREYKIESLH